MKNPDKPKIGLYVSVGDCTRAFTYFKKLGSVLEK